MAVDPDSPEANIDAAAPLDQPDDLLWRLRIGKDAVLLPRRERRIDQVVKLAIHETAEAERMVDWHPTIVVVQILVHVDQHDIAAIDPLVVHQLRENRKLIDRTHWQNERRGSSGG